MSIEALLGRTAFPLVALLVLISGAAEAQVAETSAWPMSGGDSRNTCQAPAGPDVSEYRVQWSYLCTSKVYSTPVVADGVVYVQDTRTIVHAIDAKTGRGIWTSKARVSKKQTESKADEGLGDLTDTLFAEVGVDVCMFSSPIIAGDKIISALQSGVITAFRRSDGEVLWQRELPKETYASPKIVGDRVVYGCIDAKVYALELASGEIAWTYETGDVVGSTPAVSRSGRIHVLSNDKRLHVLDGKTGRPIEIVDVGYRSNSHVLSAQASLFFTSTGDRFQCFDLIDRKIRWHVPKSGRSHMHGIGYRDGKVFLQNGKRFVCYRATDAEVVWQFETDDDGSYVPCLGKDLIYFRDNSGVYALKIATGELVWKEKTGGTIATPVLVDGTLYVCDAAGNIHAVR